MFFPFLTANPTSVIDDLRFHRVHFQKIAEFRNIFDFGTSILFGSN
jgi:hypothetical protein